MNQIKIIFFDIDGTLVDMDTKQISKKTLYALHALQKKNIMLCLATGRGPIGVPHFPHIKFDVNLTFNGSYCYSDTKCIHHHAIPKEDILQIVKNASNINRPVSIATKDGMYANGKDDDLVQYFAFSNLEVHVVENFLDIIEEKEIYQMMLGCRKDDYEAIMENVNHAQIAAWWSRAIDIIPKNAGKGKGIEKVLEYYHLDASQALAFGDGNNDIEMLQAVGCGVAMGNASNELKSIADEVCKSVKDEGIYAYCVQHAFIDEIS